MALESPKQDIDHCQAWPTKRTPVCETALHGRLDRRRQQQLCSRSNPVTALKDPAQHFFPLPLSADLWDCVERRTCELSADIKIASAEALLRMSWREVHHSYLGGVAERGALRMRTQCGCQGKETHLLGTQSSCNGPFRTAHAETGNHRNDTSIAALQNIQMALEKCINNKFFFCLSLFYCNGRRHFEETYK